MAASKVSKAGDDSVHDSGSDQALGNAAPQAAQAAAGISPKAASDQAPDDTPAQEPHPGPENAPTPEAVVHDQHGDDHDDDHGTSLAARALQAVGLVLLGGIITLWAAPQIAPHLPRGMAPLAEWLSPGGTEAIERIEAAEADLSAEMARILARMDQIGAGQAGADTEARALVAQVEALDTRLAAQETAAPDLAALDQISARQDTLQAAFDALADDLAAADTDGAPSGAEVMARLASHSAALEALRDDVLDLNARLDALEHTALEQARAASAEADQSRVAGEVRAALAGIGLAIDTGAPWSAQLQALSLVSDQPVPDALVRLAPVGVASPPALRQAFGPAAHAAIRADILADTAGRGQVLAFLSAQVATRSLIETEGERTDARLSQAEAALIRDDLARVLALLSDLPPAAQAEMAILAAQVQERHEARQALDALRADLVASGG